MPLKQLATIATPDARTLVLTPFDKNQMAVIEKAILAANIGLTPTNDGKVIRLIIPALTEERRKDLVKVAKKMAEEGRIAVRNIRRHAMDELKRLEKAGEMSQDDQRLYSDEVQSETDRTIKEIDEVLEVKQQEIMQG